MIRYHHPLFLCHNNSFRCYCLLCVSLRITCVSCDVVILAQFLNQIPMVHCRHSDACIHVDRCVLCLHIAALFDDVQTNRVSDSNRARPPPVYLRNQPIAVFTHSDEMNRNHSLECANECHFDGNRNMTTE